MSDPEPGRAYRRWHRMELTCPKCHGPMRSYERNGVHVDQCTECRGIFLDRGELERLVDAENSWHGEPAAAGSPTSSPTGPQPRSTASQIEEAVSGILQSRSHAGAGHHGAPYGYPRKRKKSFLEQLFD